MGLYGKLQLLKIPRLIPAICKKLVGYVESIKFSEKSQTNSVIN